MQDKLEILLLDDEKIVGTRLKPALTKIGGSVEVFEDPKKIHEEPFYPLEIFKNQI